MKTTALFVELIVIGAGALIALGILITAVFDINLQFVKENLLLFSIPLLSFTYLLGIIVDRIADNLFDSLHTEKKTKLQGDYYLKANIAAKDGEKLYELLEYTRSRVRISRGWLFNFFLIETAVSIHIGCKFSSISAPFYLWLKISAIFFGFALITYFTWKKLVHSYFQKVDRIASYLIRLRKENND